MMEKQEKTRYKLAMAVKECMKITPVDKITVKDIVEGAGVARQTFYRNFLDKYDLINWYFDKLVLACFEEIGVSHTVEESLTQKFRFIREEKAFFRSDFGLLSGVDSEKDREGAGAGYPISSGDVLPGICVYDSEVDSGGYGGGSGAYGQETGGSHAGKIGAGF